MELNLETLGITREQLTERVIDKMCETLLHQVDYDEDGNQTNSKSFLRQKLDQRVVNLIDTSILNLAEKHVLPNVQQYIETLTLQERTKWGEKVGQPLTFIEYLVSRAEAYLREEVNYEGKSRAEAGNYSFTSAQTRLTNMVHKHLHYEIKTSMDNAVNAVQKAIAPALAETVKIKLAEITAGLKVDVSIKK